MAAFFHGAPEIQTDGALQTLYLMNPSFSGYSDMETAAPPTPSPEQNMIFLNSGGVNMSISQASPHFVGIPISDRRHSPAVYNLSLYRPEDLTAAADISPTSGGATAGVSVASNGGSVLMGSKYLKVAQQLLDEVVKVSGFARTAAAAAAAAEKIGEGDGGGGRRVREIFSGGEKQELQLRKTKLVGMLDEVEQCYRHYHHHMQLVSSSFEAAAGDGSATTYTSLALQTISRQFRCLQDAISVQIRRINRSLGMEEATAITRVGVDGGGGEGSKLRFVDHHLRQQRAMQQLGMAVHQNAWRPQRGLPERSVSILRAWLFEHFLHPYPKDSDKMMLAKQTGLTRSQVSNWFINARVRLWKPMVEEMYLEETKEQTDGTAAAHEDRNCAAEANSVVATARRMEINSLVATDQTEPSAFSGDLARPPAVRVHDYAFFSGELAPFAAGHFTPRAAGNGVSLTLGLPHGGDGVSYQSNNLRIAMTNDQGEDDDVAAINGYESINNIQSRKRFGAHLLQNFVS